MIKLREGGPEKRCGLPCNPSVKIEKKTIAPHTLGDVDLYPQGMLTMSDGARASVLLSHTINSQVRHKVRHMPIMK